jgi:hypothetical protein
MFLGQYSSRSDIDKLRFHSLGIQCALIVTQKINMG